ncbi:hypothetical protein SeMB42_g03115 [Synchytrium endobioticum]|uniref:Uncharacterized protein n=1 Tax=Synchytrium endobioticum TaxID=286115 RepID=A0A507D9Q9_9FUNG|nr:hypothetical protein SeLEV6574_g05825 [Synchytrium endobioticum]TPX48115.1 hypothetical protein SeMB42_g03115 [Synchytrium endobioticum]
MRVILVILAILWNSCCTAAPHNFANLQTVEALMASIKSLPATISNKDDLVALEKFLKNQGIPFLTWYNQNLKDHLELATASVDALTALQDYMWANTLHIFRLTAADRIPEWRETYVDFLELNKHTRTPDNLDVMMARLAGGSSRTQRISSP